MIAEWSMSEGILFTGPLAARVRCWHSPTGRLFYQFRKTEFPGPFCAFNGN